MIIKVKILSGDCISLDIENILNKLNQINPIQYPLRRTKLIKDDTDPELYHAFVYTTHLCFELTHYSGGDENGFVINKYISEEEYHKKDNELVEGMDGLIFDEWRDMTALQAKLEMPNSTTYRLYVISTINSNHGPAIVSYKYDTNEQSEYEKIAQLLKNKEIKLNEEHVKNVMLKYYDTFYSKDYKNKFKDKDSYEIYKDSIYFRDDTIMVLNCNGEMLYTHHFHWYHHSYTKSNWDYYQNYN